MTAPPPASEVEDLPSPPPQSPSEEITPSAIFKFTSLPPEIRTRIWSLLDSPPQVIDLVAPCAPRANEASLYPLSSARNRNANILLRICRESRSVFLHGRRHFISKSPGEQGKEEIKGKEVYFNPKEDILYLADPDSERTENRISSLKGLRVGLGKIVEDVRYLAIPYVSWRQNGIYGELSELKYFTALKGVWVSWLGGSERQKRRGSSDGDYGGRREKKSWLDQVQMGVGENICYLDMIEREVRGDLWALERRFKVEEVAVRWNTPELGFVRGRGCLDTVVERREHD